MARTSGEGRFRPLVEQLENRCVPAPLPPQLPSAFPGTIKAPIHAPLSPASLTDVIAIARHHTSVLIGAARQLEQARARARPRSLSQKLLAQSLVVIKAEAAAMQRLTRVIVATRPTPRQAFYSVFQLEVAFGTTNSRLVLFQVNEILARRMSVFAFSPTFTGT